MDLGIVKRLIRCMHYAEYVGLAGNGEPFLHPDIMEILRIICATGAIPSVVTNATILDHHVIKELMQMPKVLLLASIDAATKQTFEYIRRGARFENIIYNLRCLHELKQEKNTTYPALNFVVCLMKDNIAELSNIVTLAHSVGATLVIAQNILPYNSWAERNVVTDKEQIAREVARAVRTAARLHIGFQYLPMGECIEDRLQKIDMMANSGFYCDFLWQQLHVEIDGNIRYCCFWTQGDAGNVLHQDPVQIWKSEGFEEVRKRLKQGEIPDDCRECHMLVLPSMKKALKTSVRELRELWKR